MNLLTVSAAGFVMIFIPMLILAEYVLRLIAQKNAHNSFGQGLATLIH